MFTRQRNINSLEDIKTLLRDINRCGFIIKMSPFDKNNVRNICYVDVGSTKCKITFKLIKTITFVFDLDGNVLTEQTVLNACAQLNKACKVEDVSTVGFVYDKTPGFDGKPTGYREVIGSASPLKDCNKKFAGTSNVAYGYDMSSAYLQVLSQIRVPIISTMKKNAKVGPNQVGFYRFGICKSSPYDALKFTYVEGIPCDFVFDLTPDAPYKDWAIKLFNKIQNTPKGIERDKLKDIPRLAVGQQQNHNPFFRCMVVETCNKLIKSLIDENTIYYNTDSIISIVPRPDIMARTDYKFHEDHTGCVFRLDRNKLIYQWDHELPKIGGYTKRCIEHYNKTHDEPWELNKDNYPTMHVNLYQISCINNMLVLKINE